MLAFLEKSVWVAPGQSVLTDTPVPESSALIAFEKLSIKDLVAQYTASIGHAANEPVESDIECLPRFRR